MDELLERLEALDDDSSLDGSMSPEIETHTPSVDRSEVHLCLECYSTKYSVTN